MEAQPACQKHTLHLTTRVPDASVLSWVRLALPTSTEAWPRCIPEALKRPLAKARSAQNEDAQGLALQYLQAHTTPLFLGYRTLRS